MSLPKEGSLLDLARKCTELDRLFWIGEWTYKDFDEAQELIDNLQTSCPNHDGVLKARIEWYRRGFNNFVANLSEIIEGFKSSHDPSDVIRRIPGQIMSLYSLRWYIRREYLTNEFSAIFERVEALFDMIAEDKDVHISVRELFCESRKNLKTSILEEKL